MKGVQILIAQQAPRLDMVDPNWSTCTHGI